MIILCYNKEAGLCSLTDEECPFSDETGCEMSCLYSIDADDMEDICYG
jgi:hypothetical protein